ncbi:hypothetical protein PPYR_09663 [Photinus pyralis]|uniref:Uncharacterized protein n=1 Tax=Photinus pyralis TaxID=7054 RepID=A0A5N4AMV3_PHOPY|nr:uncharacterized protein LOC116172250 [Photinus pyralis]KAB0798670.1 hypothetical protein PPYR_09663 [Photinus pyralis]
MFSCNCLNVIVESETNDFQHANLDHLNLSEEEKQDLFFKQDVRQVDKLRRINKEHSGLVASRNVGNWIVHQCLNCDVQTHAIHRDRGAACVLISTKLLNSALITTVRNSELYSNVFHILISPEKENNFDEHHDRLPPDVELALSGLKQRVTEFISSEATATEDRIRVYTEQQYAALDKFRERAQMEHKILSRVIMEKRYQPMNLSENFIIPSSPNSRLSDTVPVLNANINSPSDNAKTKLITKMKTNSNRITARQMSTPVGYGKSIDSEGLFQLEEMEDPYPYTVIENDSDNDVDSSKTDGAQIPRSKNQQCSIAKSLPVTIPTFMSQIRNRIVEEEHDDEYVLQDNEDHPSDIAASIKALAKSVHGDTVFGDLPRPRFSTQI